MTNNEITAIWESIPGKFMVDFGYQQFAHRLLEAVEIRTSDIKPLAAELRWCLANAPGPRTEAALQWALDTLEEMEQTTEEQT
ncbi:hypothetical protein SAMN05216466_107156 [Paraburkholderia phenazinium]|jgi:hypothetical protein|uniref:Uncharacterized protein n=1 Tax=Paraburkholderia phenazinium TaxID=60549 RepID=A0A1G7ZSI6_9BURK|nr:hypothetical protein [Paraburkholderia phenazinium]SDH11638.1 hypothetical protein SAMN05216466_107156 [Paraburkholderia phenazinium]